MIWIEDKNGVSAVVGFILSFLISALILSASILAFTSALDITYRRAAEMELQDLANRIVAGVEHAVEIYIKFPNATYVRTIPVLEEVKGRQYYIQATNDTIYVNTTDGISVKSTTYRAEVIGIKISGKVYSGARSLSIYLKGEEKMIEIRGG